MKTEELITLLARQAGPAPKVQAMKRLLTASIAGGLLAAALVVGLFGLIPGAMFFEPGPWVKLLYAGALASAAASLAARAGKPGASGKQAVVTASGIVFIMLLIGFVAYINTEESARAAALMGHSWLSCPWIILLSSIPVMVGTFWAMKGLAPTNLPLAGAACGLFSGSVASMAYALACTEPATPFIAIWYTLGIALCTGLGAMLGPRFLKW